MSALNFVHRVFRKAERVTGSWLPPEPVLLPGRPWQEQVDLLQYAGTNVRVDPSVRFEGPYGLTIGNDVSIGAGSFLDAQAGLILCSGVKIADNVSLLSSLPLPEKSADPELSEDRFWSEIFIGPDVTIGTRACIFPGITIGEGAQIAPGAEVYRDVPAGTKFGFTRSDAPRPAPADIPAGAESEFPPTDPEAAAPVSGRAKAPRICFVATTGRSGSTAIVDLLRQHEQIIAKHEPRNQLIKLSTDYAHGLVTREDAKARLERLFLDGSIYHPDRIYVESDQKYFNLIPLLQEVLPEARFIWLVRSADKVVASAYSRSWYADSSHPVWHQIWWYYNKHRVAGDHAGAMPAADWAAMSPFERNCWYWAFVNETIEKDLAAIAPERHMLVRLEDLNTQVDAVLEFLGADAAALNVAKSNAAFYKKTEADAWEPEQVEAFERICGPVMKRLYG